MDTKTYLDNEIKRLYDKMSTLEPGSDEYGTLETRWNELVNQRLEFERMKETRKDRVSRCASDVFKVVVPLGTAVVMSLLAYTFEAKGVIPVGVGKKWADKLTKY
jgi:hypothetical protein